MDQLTSGERRQVDPAGKKLAVQGGDSEAEMEMEVMEDMQSKRKSDEGLQYHVAGKRSEVQGGDSEVEMEMEVREEMPIKRKSDEGLQLHPAGTNPEVQGGDADKMGAVMRSEMLQILMQNMQLGDEKELLAKLLKCEEGNQQQKQESQRVKQEMLQKLMPSMQLGDQKEMFAKLLKYAETQPQKQEMLENQSSQLGDQKEILGKLLKCDEENLQQKQEIQQQKQEIQQQKQEIQQQKQKKKPQRKSRMAIRKLEMDKAKKSNLEIAPREDKAAAYLALWAKEDELEAESESRSDWHAYRARLSRDRWNESFARHYGAYEKTTQIRPMRFTDYPDESAAPGETLQIFSVKVVGVNDGIDWPLKIYGVVAVRDTVDRNRNIVFDRKRDNYQTVTEKDPYLILTGPSRAAVLSVRHSYVEAELKIRDSSSDSEDKDFSYLASGFIQTGPCESFAVERVVRSRLSTLEFTVGHIVNSVEATVSVEVRSGEWPSGYEGIFTVSTASMEDMEMTLLSFGGGGLPLEDGGNKIKLSRCVVGVEVDGRLNVAVKALLPGGSSDDVLSDKQDLTPKESGRSKVMLKVGSCEMVVEVAWSLLLTYDPTPGQ